VYLTELVPSTAELPSRRGLRSASIQQYEVPRKTLKFGERAFSFAGPAAWNVLNLILRADYSVQTCSQTGFSNLQLDNCPYSPSNVNRYFLLYVKLPQPTLTAPVYYKLI